MYNQNKFKKLEKRLAKGINGGSFFQLAKEKQAQLARRIQRYANSLKQAVKPAILSAFLALGLSNAAQAQITFTAQTGSNNPFNGFTLNAYSLPAFVDIDNDGDMDAFVGSLDSVRYFKNNGNATSPNLVRQVAALNPLSGISGAIFLLDFADLDNDGDEDAVIFVDGSGLRYYQNTGTAAAPTFTLQTGTGSPVNGITVGNFTRPTLVDIDNDGDTDLFLGNGDGTIAYYRNTGTAAAPVFTAQTGSNNPFNGLDLGASACLTFADLDNDGDNDVAMGFYGSPNSYVQYYQNTGTASSPSFSATQFLGVNNPFNGATVPLSSLPEFVDMDGDGKTDIFIGDGNGGMKYYKNTTIVGIKPIAEPDALNLFPNPTQGQLYFTEPLEGKLEVYNLMGQLVMEQNLQNTTSIDISPLENGTYILKLNSDKEVFVDKIRLER